MRYGGSYSEPLTVAQKPWDRKPNTTNKCSPNAGDPDEYETEDASFGLKFDAYLAATGQGSNVILHVYHLNSWTRNAGMPIFHLGVQVYRLEYFFCSHGILSCVPTENTAHIFKESVHLGTTELSLRQVMMVVAELKKDWGQGAYSVLGHNCQNFAVAFCAHLGLPDAVPAEYHFKDIATIRSQFSHIFDGAAALWPQQPEGAGERRMFSFEWCKPPDLCKHEFCSEARAYDEAIGPDCEDKNHTFLHTDISPEFFRPSSKTEFFGVPPEIDFSTADQARRCRAVPRIEH
jgi:hypothetical protein